MNDPTTAPADCPICTGYGPKLAHVCDSQAAPEQQGEPVFHLRSFGDVSAAELEAYAATPPSGIPQEGVQAADTGAHAIHPPEFPPAGEFILSMPPEIIWGHGCITGWRCGLQRGDFPDGQPAAPGAAVSTQQADATPKAQEQNPWHTAVRLVLEATPEQLPLALDALRDLYDGAAAVPVEPVATVTKRLNLLTGESRFVIQPHAGFDLEANVHRHLFDSPQLLELSDEQIIRIAQTLGDKVPGVSDYASWGLGYAADAYGRHTIPNVPGVAIDFARAVLAAAVKPDTPPIKRCQCGFPSPCVKSVPPQFCSARVKDQP